MAAGTPRSRPLTSKASDGWWRWCPRPMARCWPLPTTSSSCLSWLWPTVSGSWSTSRPSGVSRGRPGPGTANGSPTAIPASAQTRHIKLGEVDGGNTFSVTSAEYRDSCPSFDPTGTYLYFLSQRTFDPVYDSLFFDLGFPLGTKPYLVTLQSSTPSPFVVRPEPEEPPASHHPGSDNGATEPAPSSHADEPVRVDLEGIEHRVVDVPVPEARYEAIMALKNKLLLLSRPVHGSLERNFWDGTPFPDGLLEYYDLVEDRRETLLTEVADIVVSGDRDRLAYTTSGPDEEHPRRLRVIASSTKPEEDREKEPPGRRSGFVDLGRVRVLVDPGAEWAADVERSVAAPTGPLLDR